MASSKEFVDYICEQISGCGIVCSKRMFGEYMAYLNGKPIFLICDDTLFVKIFEETTKILGEETEQGFPYNGAKSHYIVSDVDNTSLMAELGFALEKVTPLPKIRKKK